MAAELVHAARSENAGEPERLRFWWCWPNNTDNKFSASWGGCNCI
uniref:Uncharacterized protein n=1 Tax=Arundo donax TaxID=35708 RepID=A0A0A9I0F8_ARUDO